MVVGGCVFRGSNDAMAFITMHAGVLGHLSGYSIGGLGLNLPENCNRLPMREFKGNRIKR